MRKLFKGKQTPVVARPRQRSDLKNMLQFSRNSIYVPGFDRNLFRGGNNRLGFINENCISYWIFFFKQASISRLRVLVLFVYYILCMILKFVFTTIHTKSSPFSLLLYLSFSCCRELVHLLSYVWYIQLPSCHQPIQCVMCK